ncbi:hypothetical protein T439DRAFT_379437 [Meredithblackwellia eburnea MCA 4105]
MGAPHFAMTNNDDSLDPIQDIFQQFDNHSNNINNYDLHDSEPATTPSTDFVRMFLHPGATADSSDMSSLGLLDNKTSLSSSGLYDHNHTSPLSSASSPGFASSLSLSNTTYSTPSVDNNAGPSPSFSNSSNNFDLATSSSSSSTTSSSFVPPATAADGGAFYPDFRPPVSISAQLTQSSTGMPNHQSYYNQNNNNLNMSLSPPDSAASSDGNAFVSNDQQFARLIASAHNQHPQSWSTSISQKQQQPQFHQQIAPVQLHSQAQAQAMLQAAYTASYLAQSQQSQPGQPQRPPTNISGTPPPPMVYYQDPTTGLLVAFPQQQQPQPQQQFATTYPLISNPGSVTNDSSATSSSSTGNVAVAKRRKVVPGPAPPPPPLPHQQQLSGSRVSSSASISSMQRRNGGSPTRKPAPVSAGAGAGAESGGMRLPDDAGSAGTFSFSLKPGAAGIGGGGGGAGEDETAPRSSVELIANAGIIAGPDAKKVYRDDQSPKLPINRIATVPGKRPSSMLGPERKAPATAAKATASKAAGGAEKKKKGDKGHNAVERRYRNNINNAIATLRDIVPALRHLKPLPSMPASRRRASQFTLSSASQAPTPAGLIDGIPAAKTLSKGSILGKAIEYIQYLQGAREDGAEDIELFKSVVREMVAGGDALVDAFDQRRAAREVEREKTRELLRKEQALLDEEDNSGEEAEEEEEDKSEAGPKGEEASDQDLEEDDSKMSTTTASAAANAVRYPPPLQPQRQSSLSQLEAQIQSRPTSQSLYGYQEGFALGTFGSPNPFPPSPVSSDEHVSPRSLSHQQFQSHGPPRKLFAAFLGLSFAGGLGYEWSLAAEDVAGAAGARAWAGRLVRRAAPEASSSAAAAVKAAAIISSDVINPALLSGLVFLGISSIFVSLAFLLAPLFRSSSKRQQPFEFIEPRSAYRQRRRASALASLANLNEIANGAKTYGEAARATLAARKELLRLVGAPTYGLLPALAKEALATALRNVTTIRVGTFSSWAEEDRVEVAVAWVRIAEIESTVGLEDVNFLTRCYTFLRLFNLSRSSHWPLSTPTTSRPAVNAVLAIHLLGLGQPLSAHALWNRASRGDRKKTDVPLDPWVEIAISSDFDQVRSILAKSKSKDARDSPSPTDSVPLLHISEDRCEAILRETWAKIFVSVVQSSSPAQNYGYGSKVERFATIVDQLLREGTIENVIASTGESSTVHAMAKVTHALCLYYTNGPASNAANALEVASDLALQARAGGPVSRLACAGPFFHLLFDDDDEYQLFSSANSNVEGFEPANDIDILACATLGCLKVEIVVHHADDLSVTSYGSPLLTQRRFDTEV